MKSYFFFPTPGQTRLLACLYILLGIVLCFCGASLILNAVRVLGGLLLAYGGWELYLYFGKRLSSSARPLIQGIPLVFIGLILLFSPKTLVSIFPVVIGIVVIFNSMVQMQKSFLLKDARDQTWMVSFILAIFMMIGGLMLILQPIQIIAWITRIGGIFLIAEGIFMLAQSFLEQKYLRRR